MGEQRMGRKQSGGQKPRNIIREAMGRKGKGKGKKKMKEMRG